MALPKVKIELVGHGVLDISSDFPLPINFDINDVRDISKRNGMWSKTIKIPGTNNNNSIFESVFNVNLQSQVFNPQVKVDAIISVDGLSTLEAVFQLRKIHKKYTNDEDYQVWYDCYLKSETSSFYSDISGKYLTDLDLSEYDHTWTPAEVQNSMNTGSWVDGYQYILGYTADPYADYEARDLVPSIYVKTYWDKIFTEAGYTYEFDELYDIKFDKLIVPPNAKYKSNKDDYYKFAAGWDTTSRYKVWQANNFNSPASITLFEPVLNPNNDDNAVEGWNDSTDLYSTTLGQYSLIDNGIPFSGYCEFNIKFFSNVVLELERQNPGPPISSLFPVTSNGQTARYSITAYIGARVYDSTGAVINTLAEQQFWEGATNGMPVTNNVLQGGFTSGETIVDTVDVDFTFGYDSTNWISQASYIETYLRVEYTSPSGYLFGQYRSFAGNFAERFFPYLYFDVLAQTNSSGNYSNTPDSYLTESGPVIISNIVPKQVKQSDFILSIVKMHNLYFQPDKYNPTNIIIKTRDKFYQDGSELDWTRKIDTKSIDVELISNTQKKIKTFSYKKDDKDQINKDYTEQTNEIYGQFEYVFENEFIKDIDKVEPIFSPTFITPLSDANGGTNRNVPFIDFREPNNNIRILYAGNIVNGSWSYYNGQGNVPANYTDYSAYRFAGHLYPNVSSPEFDLNFGICDYYSHTGPITNNNLFNQHYYDQMNIFENGHIMSALFNLSFADITALDLNERIYVHDSWWHINKIIDYNVNGNNLTRVELITADTLGQSFTPDNNVVINESRPTQFGKAINKHTVDSMNGNTFGIGTANVKVLGVNNVIQPGSVSSVIAGNNNQVQSSNSLVTGNNNIVRADNTSAIGISDAAFDEDGGRVYATTLVRFTNFISAGRDEVLGAFPDNKVVNSLDAGRDEVRPLGGYSIETNVVAGRDSILYNKG